MYAPSPLPCPSRSQHTSCNVACRAATKGFWAEALGQGDFYYELGIQCIKVCIRTRDQNGGLMEVEEMCRLLSRLRKPQRIALCKLPQYRRGWLRAGGAGQKPISSDDVETAVGTLKPLGSYYGIRRVGRKKLVQSVPTELNDDHMRLLNLVEQSGGHTTKAEIAREGWDAERVGRALETLLEEGMLWIDDQAPGSERWYWSMCLTNDLDADVREGDIA